MNAECRVQNENKAFVFNSSLCTLTSSLSFQPALLEILPLLFRLSGEVAWKGFDRDTILSAKLPPEQKARVILPRLVRDFIGYLRLSLFLFSAQLSSPHL
jgi:hypothetical protein